MKIDDPQLIADIAAFLKKYVRLSDDEYLVIAAWVLHCHAWLAWTRTPYLNVSSATEECGKTVLLELLDPLVPNALLISNCSAAVLPRIIDKEHLPLLIDEIDRIAKGDKELWSTILGIINSGYKRSGTKIILEPQKGGGWRPKKLSTFCPKVLSGISAGLLPSSTVSRCIPINMQRMLPNDRVTEIDEYITEPEANALFARCQDWGKAHLKQLRDARPDAPAALGHRQREVSRPLLAIADAMGGEWGNKLRSALVRLFKPRANEPEANIQIQLLHDMEGVFGTRQRISSKDAAERLGADADSPWSSWGKSPKPITQAQLARQLWHFKIVPKMQRNDDGTNLRGYDQEQFKDLWKRYPKPKTDPTTTPPTPTSPHSDRNKATTPINIDENEFSDRNNESSVAPWKSASDPHKQRLVAGVAVKSRVNGGGEGEQACYVHGKNTTWWRRADGDLVCQRCHPKPI